MVKQRRGLTAVAVAVLLGLAAPAVASAAPSALRVNGASSPLGIDSAPRFAWEAGVGRQSAYEIEVSRGASVVWDSGKVASSDDLDIPYGGPARESGTRYTWRVRVWDALGAVSDWSAPASYETGLLNLSDWGSAEWIGGRAKQDHDWMDMTFTSDFRVTTGATGITFLFHAQPVGKAWGEGYAWQVRSLTASTTLFAPAAAGDTNVKVAATTNFNVGDTLSIESEQRTITAVGTQGRATTLSATSTAGATNVKVASVTGLVAGEPIVIDGETATIQTVGTQGATGTGVTLAQALASAHPNAAAVRFNGTGIGFAPALTAAHAQNAALSTPGSVQLVMATRHYSGNTGCARRHARGEPGRELLQPAVGDQPDRGRHAHGEHRHDQRSGPERG